MGRASVLGMKPVSSLDESGLILWVLAVGVGGCWGSGDSFCLPAYTYAHRRWPHMTRSEPMGRVGPGICRQRPPLNPRTFNRPAFLFHRIGRDKPVRNGHRTDGVRCHWSICLQTFESLVLPQPILKALKDIGYDTPTPIRASHPARARGTRRARQRPDGHGQVRGLCDPDAQPTAGAQARQARPRPGQAPHSSSRPREAAQIRGELCQLRQAHRAPSDLDLRRRQPVPPVKQLKRGVEIIVATPGRLMDLMQQGYVDLSAIEVFILDEADRMLDMGFIDPIRKIASKVPSERQTLLFSATMPKEIMHGQLAAHRSGASRWTRSPRQRPRSSRALLCLAPAEVRSLQHLLAEPGVERAIVFSKTKHGADKLAKVLGRGGVPSSTIHGNKSQNQQARIEAFRSGRAVCSWRPMSRPAVWMLTASRTSTTTTCPSTRRRTSTASVGPVEPENGPAISLCDRASGTCSARSSV